MRRRYGKRYGADGGRQQKDGNGGVEKRDGRGKLRGRMVSAGTLVSGIVLAAGAYQFLGIAFSASLFCVLAGILFFWNRKQRHLADCRSREWLSALVPALFLGYFSQYFFRVDLWYVAEYWKYINMAGVAGSFYFLFLMPAYHYMRLLDRKGGSAQYVQLLTALALLLYLFLLGFPMETYLSNQEEYLVPFTDILKMELLPFFSVLVLAQAAVSLLPEPVFRFFRFLFLGLALAVYIQVMFLNVYVGQLTGAEYDWRLHPVFTAADLAVWLLLLAGLPAAGILTARKAKADRFFTGAALAVLAVHLVGVASLLVQAPDDIWVYKQYLYDSAEQYAVADGENVIVFVMDTIDNNDLKELLAEKPEAFADLCDFTCYLNTASVFDMTGYSLPQMMTGYSSAEDEDVSSEFYERIRDDGYKVHFYNYEWNSSFPNINQYIDNFVYFGSIEAQEEVVVNESLLKNSIRTLSLFQSLPCLWKSKADISRVDFYHCFNIAHFQPFSDYQNRDFDEGLNLWLQEDEQKYFIFQHISGTHIPCDDAVETTEYCLSILSKMIGQMKQLGVYDDATILVVSDHGAHDSDDGDVFPTAATPIFLLKEKGKASEEMEFSDKPVYHKDILSTLLVDMGLFDGETDYDLFGSSVYDLEEDTVRTRVWYDSELPSSRLRRYEFTGDTKELERVVEEDEYTTVDFNDLLGNE